MRRVLKPVPLAVIVALAALLALLAYGMSASEPDRGLEDALARGERDRAPALDLPHLSGGGRGSLDELRGHVVVLNFWASWCDPCRAESPLLERWQRRLARREGTVVGVDVLDVAEDARRFVREYALTYPMLRDRDGEALSAFGVVAYPETFAIDRRGRIAALRRGPVDESWMRRHVLPLLGEPA
jgi:cytochrome c biogenesis protein CcmG/thiol:disulfide interchange protein DsbE